MSTELIQATIGLSVFAGFYLNMDELEKNPTGPILGWFLRSFFASPFICLALFFLGTESRFVNVAVVVVAKLGLLGFEAFFEPPREEGKLQAVLSRQKLSLAILAGVIVIGTVLVLISVLTPDLQTFGNQLDIGNRLREHTPSPPR